ncbi:aminotransferase class I/II-fold pyridoxal phosphate-dependent enzyme, partial [bacterium]|nr:aminotransferase class I/II-fold pyridoxal phosphate-dependent enzyme [bacterium]
MAQRTGDLHPSSIRRMMGISKRLIMEGKTVYELNIGQPDIPCIPIFSEAISSKVREGHLNYSPYIGETYLRETFSRYLNRYFDRQGTSHLVTDTNNVLVTCGASHALAITFMALCDPGDEILCVEPFFEPYKGLLAVSGGILKPIPTSAESGFALPSSEEIEKLITSKTKGILYNSPNNPSGKIFTKEEVTKLSKIAIKHNIFIIADEVYREMVLGNQEAFSLLQVELEKGEMEKFKHRIIVIDSASKAFSVCGARVGFIVARPEVIEKLSLLAFHSVASISDLMQFGVSAAYDHVFTDRTYFESLRKTYRERLDSAIIAVKDFLSWAVVPKPNGAFYLMIQFADVEDASDFCLFILEKFNLGNETVAVTPA